MQRPQTHIDHQRPIGNVSDWQSQPKCVVLILLLILISIRSQAAFFNSDVSARAAGMGGAFVAVADDTTSVFWNPAGIAQIGHFEFASTQVAYPVETFSTQLMAGSIPMFWNGTFALSLLQTGAPDLYREQTLQLTYGHDLYDWINLPLSVGLSFKRLSLSYPGADVSDPLFTDGTSKVFYTLPSFGLLYRPLPNFKIAAAQDNPRPIQLSFNSDDEGYNRVNRTFRVGVAWTPGHTTLTAEVASEKFAPTYGSRKSILRAITTYSTQFRIGAEHWIQLNLLGSELAVRAGRSIGNYDMSSWNMGAGYRFALSRLFSLQFDYAFSYAPTSELGNYHRMSLLIAR